MKGLAAMIAALTVLRCGRQGPPPAPPAGSAPIDRASPTERANPASAPPPPRALPAASAMPSAPPMDPGLHQRAQAVLAKRGWVGASVAVWHRGRWRYVQGLGLADLRTRRPMTPSTPLYAGSLSKVVTAATVLRLRDEGRLELRQTVSSLLPRFASAPVGKATITHLLEHRAGLSREGDFGYWFSGTFPDGAAFDHALGHEPASPGPARSYSNLGYAMLGRVIAQVTSKGDYGAAVRERWFKPLGLRASKFVVPEALRNTIARGYSPPGRILPNAVHPFAGLGDQVGDRRERLYHDAAAMAPAFGLLTTARELANIVRAVALDGARLSSASRQKWLGLLTYDARRKLHTHTGWFAAHTSYLAVAPERELVVVVLTNCDEAQPGDLGRALVDVVDESDTK